MLRMQKWIRYSPQLQQAIWSFPVLLLCYYYICMLLCYLNLLIWKAEVWTKDRMKLGRWWGVKNFLRYKQGENINHYCLLLMGLWDMAFSFFIFSHTCQNFWKYVQEKKIVSECLRLENEFIFKTWQIKSTPNEIKYLTCLAQYLAHGVWLINVSYYC